MWRDGVNHILLIQTSCPTQPSKEHLCVLTPNTRLLKVAVSKDYTGCSLHSLYCLWCTDCSFSCSNQHQWLLCVLRLSQQKMNWLWILAPAESHSLCLVLRHIKKSELFMYCEDVNVELLCTKSWNSKSFSSQRELNSKSDSLHVSKAFHRRLSTSFIPWYSLFKRAR